MRWTAAGVSSRKLLSFARLKNGRVCQNPLINIFGIMEFTFGPLRLENLTSLRARHYKKLEWYERPRNKNVVLSSSMAEWSVRVFIYRHTHYCAARVPKVRVIKTGIWVSLLLALPVCLCRFRTPFDDWVVGT
jgi:hypothetical protein